MEKKKTKINVIEILLVIAAAAISALAMHVFVYPSNFAPSGIDGVATMLQKLTGFNAGYYTVIFNLPLLIAAWFMLNKKYVIYTLVYTLITSGLIVLLAEVDFYQYTLQYEILIAALFSGILLGVRTGVMLKVRASSGGVDIVAAMVQKKMPHVNIERIISLLCYAIMLASYFVYRDIVCILLSIVQMVVFEFVVAYVLKGNRKAIEVKIITDEPDKIKDEIIYHFKHGGYTVVGEGIFSGEKKTILSSVLNTRQIPELLRIMKNYPKTFVYYSTVEGVSGNFRWYRDDEVK